MSKRRAIIIVCDSMGVGELPDAKDFGDEGSNTLGHVLQSQHPKLPNLTRLGLLHTLPTPASSDNPQAAFGRMAEIIARPFVGPGRGKFKRTANRKDFSVRPTGPTVVERATNAGKQVIGLGKIADIFDRVGISQEIRTESNSDGMRKTIDLIRQSDADIIFTNLVDFDSKYGHRNDPVGYAKALESFDLELGGLLGDLREDDLLFITADHGCDPTDVSTDHTREYVPLIV